MGPDAVLVRVPSKGGLARAHRAGSDSVLWESRAAVPALEALLGFDDFLGVVVGQDARGHVVSLNLRVGTLDTLGTERISTGTVAQGSSVYGLDAQGKVVRLTPAGSWTWTPTGGATQLIPNTDGSLLVLGGTANRTDIRRLVPPESRILDSTSVPAVRLAARTMAGDRLWLVSGRELRALRARELTQVLDLTLRDSVVALEPTPSGDRLFLASVTDGLRIVDRYAEDFVGMVELPTPATALRMDPDGRYLLARAKGTDSVYVISIGTARVVNTLAAPWRDDLPLVTPEGHVLVLRGDAAVLVDAETGRERRRYPNGAADRWMLLRWNGFRPRAAGLDRPVEFEEYAADSAKADSALAALIAARYGDLSGITRAAPAEPSAASATAEEAPAGADAGRGTWTVSFATLLDETRARQLAETIVVDGRTARVVSGDRDGVPVWRVLLGPYDSRQDAERAGMRSRLSYWVFEGIP